MPLEEALRRYPKETLTSTPTPLQHLPHLSSRLDLKVYLKRDDLTDLALGGDKPRKLEYEIAQARLKGADTLVTCGSSQSNQARLTVAAARKLGLGCAVVLSDDQWRGFNGNLLTVYLMGARVKIVQTDDHWDLERHAQALCAELEEEGLKPHFIPVSGTTPHSCLGYVEGGLETLQQLEQGGIQLDAVYTPFGTGGIFTAMLLAFRERGLDCPFLGISVNRDRETCYANLDHWWASLCGLLDVDPQRPREPLTITDQFIGREYGDPTEACLDAILLLAQTEGILLDPVYSGKMFSGFLAHCEEKRWQPGQSILLLHSGGAPALFAYQSVIQDHLRKRGLL